MSLTLNFSKQAKETYAAIQSQLYNRFGQAVLEKFEQKTIKTLDSILQSPLCSNQQRIIQISEKD